MATTETEPIAPSPTWADSKDAWIFRVHNVELPSGIQVTYRDLSLIEFAMIKDALSTELLELAVAEWSQPGADVAWARQPSAELAELNKPTKKQEAEAEAETRRRWNAIAELNREVVAAALVEPKLTAEELRGIPMPDLEMLSLLVNRQINQDAAGRYVGVVPIDRFQIVLEAHGLEHQPGDPSCEACKAARRALAASR